MPEPSIREIYFRYLDGEATLEEVERSAQQVIERVLASRPPDPEPALPRPRA